MSIFPKHVTFGDNVIIHFKIENSKKVIQLDYKIDLFNPMGKKKRIIEKSIISSDIIECYYNYTVKENNFNIPGRYFLRTTMYINGRKSNSLSAEKDYFWIDRIKVDLSEQQNLVDIVLLNESDCSTNFSILNEEGLKEVEGFLDGKERRKYVLKRRRYFIMIILHE